MFWPGLTSSLATLGAKLAVADCSVRNASAAREKNTFKFFFTALAVESGPKLRVFVRV